MRKIYVLGAISLMGIGLVAGSAAATPHVLIQGTPILLVDGNADSNVTVNLQSTDIWDGYLLQYSLNGGAWQDVSDFWNGDLFAGGSVLDFALVGTNNQTYGTTADEFYILSNDAADDSFSVIMTFAGEIDPSFSQQPLMTAPYYKDLLIMWNIVQTGYTFSNSLAIANGEQGWNDGVAPVPEPATMFLLGAGLAGLAGAIRRKK